MGVKVLGRAAGGVVQGPLEQGKHDLDQEQSPKSEATLYT